MAIRMAVAEAVHHSSRGQKTAAAAHDALRGQKNGDVEVSKTIPQERISKPMVQHIVDVSVPQVFDEVDSVPQVVEEAVEVA